MFISPNKLSYFLSFFHPGKFLLLVVKHPHSIMQTHVLVTPLSYYFTAYSVLTGSWWQCHYRNVELTQHYWHITIANLFIQFVLLNKEYKSKLSLNWLCSISQWKASIPFKDFTRQVSLIAVSRPHHLKTRSHLNTYITHILTLLSALGMSHFDGIHQHHRTHLHC